jgi:6-phosphogluconolactonase (cycloisomerase 2 family)
MAEMCERRNVARSNIMKRRSTLVADQGVRYAFTAICSAALVFLASSTFAGETLLAIESFTDVSLNFPDDGAISEDGRQLYVSTLGDGSIVILDIDPATGTLSQTVSVAFSDPVVGMTDLAVSPGGAHVYAVADDRIFTFSRDSQSGALTQLDVDEGRFGLGGALDVVVAPDGAHVYVAGNRDTAIVVYERDPASGALITVQTVTGTELGGSGIDDVEACAISADGGHVYVVRQTNHTIAHFTRDRATGFLSFQEAFVDGIDNNNSIRIPENIALSPDGLHAYVTARASGAVSLFTRDSGTGALAFVEAYVNGIDANGLFGPREPIVSPDGHRVYVTSNGTSLDIGGLVAFNRDRLTGSLTFLDNVLGRIDGVGPMSSPTGIAVDRSGARTYIVSQGSSAVQAFEVGGPASLSGTIIDNSTDAAVDCAVVEITPSDGSTAHAAITDVNGAYIFSDLPSDTYSVRALAVGFQSITPDTVDVSPGGSVVRNYDLTARTLAGGVSGTVTDADSGRPLLGVFVQAFIAESAIASTYTCADGRYEISDLAVKGTVSVTLTFQSSNYESAEDAVEVPIGGSVESNQAMEKSSAFPATLTGVILAADDDTPIEYALVTATGPANTSTNTSSDGAYTFPALPEGLYTVHASAIGFDGETAVLSVAAAEIAESSFLMQSATEPSGEPTDINDDETIDAVDVQLVINAALGISISFDADVDDNDAVDAVDIQLVINAVLGV